jgi:hypothetical protein
VYIELELEDEELTHLIKYALKLISYLEYIWNMV